VRGSAGEWAVIGFKSLLRAFSNQTNKRQSEKKSSSNGVSDAAASVAVYLFNAALQRGDRCSITTGLIGSMLSTD
jgi:hypothetical protein